MAGMAGGGEPRRCARQKPRSSGKRRLKTKKAPVEPEPSNHVQTARGPGVKYRRPPGSGGFVLRFVLFDGLAALRTLGEVGFYQTNSLGLRHLVDGGDFASETVESGLVELALGIGLLRLVLGTEEVADHFGDRDQVA